MKPEELLDEWTGGESSGVRPKRVQQIRGDLIDVTGIAIPRRVSEIEGWLEAKKGHVTKKLRDAVEEEETGEE